MTLNALTASNLCKAFNGRMVLNDVSLHVEGGRALGIQGPNGTGKSTLVRILAGVLRPDEGSVALTCRGHVVPRERVPMHIGFVAPYVNVYDEFTPNELLRLHQRLSGISVDDVRIDECFDLVGLGHRRDAIVRELSSGQRQRVALALALVLNPVALILDEPGVTLDADGRAVVERVVSMQCNSGGFVILASNDERELQLCHTHVSTLPPSPA